MYSIEAIEKAHSKVQSGKDFAEFIREIKEMGVVVYETWVKDGHTDYYNDQNIQLSTPAKYDGLLIAETCDSLQFRTYLKLHQQGNSDYLTFCKHCAETGIERWMVDVKKSVCIYFDQYETEIYTEAF